MCTWHCGHYVHDCSLRTLSASIRASVDGVRLPPNWFYPRSSARERYHSNDTVNAFITWNLFRTKKITQLTSDDIDQRVDNIRRCRRKLKSMMTMSHPQSISPARCITSGASRCIKTGSFWDRICGTQPSPPHPLAGSKGESWLVNDSTR